MKSNTIGHIYVKFSTYYHNQTLKLGPMDIYDANLTNQNPLKLDDLSVIPNQTSITLDSNSIIIDYTVTAKNNLKGIYALPIEHLSDLSPYVVGENPLKTYQERYSKSYCHMFPLVIGLNSSQIKEETLDKFVLLNTSDNCPVSLTDQLFVGSKAIDRLPGTIPRTIIPITAGFDKETYFPGDSVMINGQIYTNDTKVTVELEKDHKLIVKSMDIPITQNGTFISNFTIPKDSAKAWSVVMVSSNGGTLTLDPNFEPFPLKQFQSGIMAKDVMCKQGLQLIFKATDDSPACVKQETSKILVERGWAKAQR
ncbi:MAG: hypothetical protein PXX83_09485 [Candidatus Nitrosotalea sp.]|nr:hypothetical protein [Candidatus Nitrosotalea sp.]